MAIEKTVDLSDDLVAEFGENANYVGDLLARYRASPESVDEEWRRFFQERLGPSAPAAPAAAAPPTRSPARETARSGGTAAPAPPAGVEPLRGGALRIAENMEASLAVPTATSQRQIPIKLADENRRLINEYRAASDESKVSFTHLFGWAIVEALRSFPRVNDAYDVAAGAPVRVKRDEVRLGLAVDVEKSDGSRTLLVPNVKAVEKLTFREFAAAVDDVISRARKGKIQLSDFEGTTVSLTNPGTLGTTASVPRLMPGQSLIVATGAMGFPAEFSAMAPETIAQLAVSKVVTFTSTYDHRIVQGAESGAFLGRIEELLLGKDGFYESLFADLGIPHKPYRWAVDRNPAFGRREEIQKQARVLELINAYRVRGHLIADVDPLRMVPVQEHPELDLETYELTIWDLDREFWTGGLKGGDHMPLRDIIAVMRRVYCGKVGIEYRFISNPVEKAWVRARVGAVPEAPPRDVRRRIFEKLLAAETFERFLGTKYLGQRRYSIEGCETAIAFLDQLLEGAGERGVEEVTIGVTHRGRL
ncbi:MAG: 2-oxo acid dehydrogenase subunit E2, partial [Acidobacteriota bacterium]